MLLRFDWQVRVSEADIDEFGHTNNLVYGHWCQRAALAHSESLGLSLARFKELGVALVLARAEYQYLAPTLRGQILRLQTRLLNFDGRSGITREFELFNEDSKCCLQACWQLRCVDLKSGRPKRMPEPLKQIYSVLMSPK